MHPPAIAMTRLLYGTATGLTLGVGFALQAERVSLADPSFAHGFSVLAVVCFASAWFLSRGKGPLARYFSNESDEAMATRVREEVEEIQRSEDVNAKWAHLEAKVLTSEVTRGEEE